MKAVLASIRPQPCYNIANLLKSIEIRKNKPKLEVPFKVYIYCTMPKVYFSYLNEKCYKDMLFIDDLSGTVQCGYTMQAHGILNGKVIGEFVCDEIYRLDKDSAGYFVKKNERFVYLYEDEQLNACISEEEMNRYFGVKRGYAWHISNLRIYDKPKELSEFISFCPDYDKGSFTEKCRKCKHYFVNNSDMLVECDCDGEKPITRSPQSWCYVEELKEYKEE